MKQQLIWKRTAVHPKRRLVFILCMCFMFLVACRNRVEEIPPSAAQATDDAEAAIVQETETLPEGQCYRQTTWPSPAGITQTEGQCVWNGCIYAFSNQPKALGAADMSGNIWALELPEEEYLYGVCDAGSALALLAGSYPSFYFDADGKPVSKDAPEGAYNVYLYDDAGEMSAGIPLKEACQEEVRGFGSNGTDFYLLFPHQVICFDSAGEQLAVSPVFDGGLLQMLVSDSAVFLREEGETLYETERIVQLDGETLQKQGAFSCASLNVHGMGVSAAGALLLVNEEYLLYPDFAAGTVSAHLSWKDNANTPANNYQNVLETETGFFALNSAIEAACFYEKLPDGETLPDPVEITLYMASFSDLKLNVYAGQFQKLYPQYQINVIKAASVQEKELALTELGAGGGYDLYLLGESQWQQLQDADVFEDLLPWMTADNSAPISAMRPGIQRILTQGGGVYRLPVGYWIQTYAVDPNRLSEYTPKAVLAACEDSSVPLYPFTANENAGEEGDGGGFEYLTPMARLCARDYVDIEHAACSFLSDSFKDQLRLLKLQEQANAEDYPCNGLLYFDVISDAGMVAYDPVRYLLPPLEDYVLCGYPSIRGNSSELHFSELFAINVRSENKAGAWAFLHYLLTQPCQQEMKLRLPINDAVLQSQLAEKLEQEKITQAEIDRFNELVDHLQTADYPTDAVVQIIKEEVEMYLAGAITEDETAERIQSRVNLMLAEQFG